MTCHTEGMGQTLSSEGKMEWWIPICLEITYAVMGGDCLKQKMYVIMKLKYYLYYNAVFNIMITQY